MASLSNAKTLGEVGSILALFPAISVIGWILVLLSLKEISDDTQDKSIFKDSMIGVITAIIGAVIIVVLLADGAAFAFVEAIIGLTADFGPGGFYGAFTTFGAFYASAIISGIFLKRAYDKSTQKLKVGQFATSGLLYLVSALTSIVVVGFLIFLIALIYQIIAFFSIRVQPQFPTYYGYPASQPMPNPLPQPSQPQVAPPPIPVPQQVTPISPSQATAPQPQTPTSPSQQPTSPQLVTPQFKFCFMCGTRLPVQAQFCGNCGMRQ